MEKKGGCSKALLQAFFYTFAHLENKDIKSKKGWSGKCFTNLGVSKVLNRLVPNARKGSKCTHKISSYSAN